jgi:hypothetical protein
MALTKLDKDMVESGVARIATGTYTGDGTTSHSITGLGFQPKYVRIWESKTSDNTQLNLGEVTPEINSDVTDAIIQNNSSGESYIRGGRFISMDDDGFTVSDEGGDQHPNANGQDYNFMAIG